MPRTPARPSQKPKSYSQRLRRNDNVSHSSSINNRPTPRPHGPRNTGLPTGYVNRVCQRRSLSSSSNRPSATPSKTSPSVPLLWPLGSVTYAGVAAGKLDTAAATSGTGAMQQLDKATDCNSAPESTFKSIDSSDEDSLRTAPPPSPIWFAGHPSEWSEELECFVPLGRDEWARRSSRAFAMGLNRALWEVELDGNGRAVRQLVESGRYVIPARRVRRDSGMGECGGWTEVVRRGKEKGNGKGNGKGKAKGEANGRAC